MILSVCVWKQRTMREEMEKVLKREFRELALKTRNRLGLTQKAMSELLSMSENSYCDIENGTYMCGTLTAILLLSMQEDPNSILQHLRIKFNELYGKEMQPI